MSELTLTKLDVRDAACDGIKAALEAEGHDVLVASADGLGLIYIDRVGPMFIVEIHEEPSRTSI